MDEENHRSTSTKTWLQNLRNIALVVYALYLLGLVSAGAAGVIGFVIAVLKAPDAKGTYLESHFQLQIRTFMWGLFWSVVGLVLAYVGVGFVVLIVLWIWLVFVWVKGLLRLLEEAPA